MNLTNLQKWEWILSKAAALHFDFTAMTTSNITLSLSFFWPASQSHPFHFQPFRNRHATRPAMIHLSMTVKWRQCLGERPKAVKFCLCEASYHKSPVLWMLFGPEWRTVYATQQPQQCVNVRRIWFVRCETGEGGGQRGVCAYVCIRVCVHRGIYYVQRRHQVVYFTSSNWRGLQYNETIELPPYSLIASMLPSYFTPLISHGLRGDVGRLVGGGGSGVVAGSGTVTHTQLLTHSTGLAAIMCLSLGEEGEHVI